MVNIIDLHFLGNEHAIASFLLETSQGPILIETGPYSTFSQLKEGIEAKGYKVEDIKHVLITHIHLDHAGAAWKFARHGAKIYLHPFGQKHMADPSVLMESARRIYKDDMDRLWSEMHEIPIEQLQVVEHGESLQFGEAEIKAWHTPGHASHHIAWQLGDILFTGDVAGVKIGNGPAVAPCPPPDINLEKWHTSIELIRALKPLKLYLTHYGEVSDIENHLTELENNLHGLADWIKVKMEEGIEKGEMTAAFEKWAESELRKHGVDDVGVKQYAAANPAWMSVAGLVRYWTKKAAQ
ncbi:MBL fold metallo-hydrolase [Limibacter armeniacum]|uniref:MBL fold metallo-hydrolase n=1 Tax=Limibacter armeniacum TaxID=466084 RepID=UPI002FE502DE